MAVAEISIDLKQLPLCAMVAHASRCARRVQPLFTLGHNHPDIIACRKAIDSAIRLAEGFAAGSHIDPGVVAEIETITVEALVLASTDGAGDKRAAYAANSAYAVINATTAALAAAEAPDPTDAAMRVLEACATATASAISADAAVERGARLDWEMLHRMRLGKFPRLGEAINPAETGMLGPLNCLKARATNEGAPGRVALHRTTSLAPSASVRQVETQPLVGRPQDSVDEDSVAASADQRQTDSRRSEKLKRTVSKLRTRREKLNAQRKAIEAERSAFVDEKTTLSTQIESLLAERTALAQQLATAESQQQAVEANRNSLADEATQHEVQLRDLKQQHDTLTKERDSLLEQKNQLEQRQLDMQAASAGDSQREKAKFQKRSKQLAELRAELEQRQKDVAEADGRLQQRSTELAALQQQLAEERRSLDQERQSLDEQRGSILNDGADIENKQAESLKRASALDEQQHALDAERKRLSATASKMASFRNRLAQRRETVAAERKALDDQRQALQKDIDAHQRVSQEHGQNVASFEQLLKNLEQAERDAQESQRELVEQRGLIETEKSQLEAQRSALSADRAAVDADRKELETIRAGLDGAGTRQADEAARLAEAQHLANQVREQLQAARDELRKSQERQQAKQTALNQERARLEEQEAELAKAKDELARQNELLKLRTGEIASQTPPAQPAQTQEGLSALLEQLHEERQRLQIERQQMTEMMSQLDASRRQPANQTAHRLDEQSQDDWTSAGLLTFLIEPGLASAKHISGILIALSKLYRALGGPGLAFEVRACRVWSYGARPESSRGKQVSQRVFAEVRARIDRAGASGRGIPDPALWERFVSSVMTVVGLDNALADHFNLGESVGDDHPAAGSVYHAVALATSASQTDALPAQQGLSIDSINQAMRQLESLRRKLQEQHQLKIELTDTPNDSDDNGVNQVAGGASPSCGDGKTNPRAAKSKKKRLFAIGGVIAVIVIIVGACVW